MHCAGTPMLPESKKELKGTKRTQKEPKGALRSIRTLKDPEGP